MTDLQKAIDNDNPLQIKQLLQNRVDPNQPIDDCLNALFYAFKQKASFESIKVLIESNLDIEQTTKEGIGALDEAIILADLKLVEYLLLREKFDPNKTKRKSNFTPLMQAASYGLIDIAKLLLEYGAKLDIVDNMQLNALDYAKKLQQKKMQKFLEEINKL